MSKQRMQVGRYAVKEIVTALKNIFFLSVIIDKFRLYEYLTYMCDANF